MIDSSTDFYKYIDNFARYRDVGWQCVYGDEQLLSKVSVTISIPTFNRPESLKDAIDSALGQETIDGFCVMVIDNNPEEGTETEALIKSFCSEKLVYFKNEQNIGMFGNQNRCFEIPKSEYVVLLHDDDILLPNYLSVCCEVANSTHLDYLQPKKIKWFVEKQGREELIIPDAKKTLNRIYDVDNYLYYRLGSPSSAFFRREAMIAIGGFSSEYYPTSDFCTAVQMGEKYRVYTLDETLAIYRVEKNASMKQETLELFLHNDYYLRKQIMNKLKFCNLVKHTLLNFIVHSQYEALRETYNPSFIFDFSCFGMKWRCPRLLYLPVRLYSVVKLFIYKRLVLSNR